MMNKSKIDWCDFSWNPVTGCHHPCEYCYAKKQSRRFSGDVKVNRGSEQLQFDALRRLYTLKQPFLNAKGKVIHSPSGFDPTLHEYRLQMPAKKKKPANIFVCSMADLFGEWVPDEWILRVFDACATAPQHNYLFLTKNPARYEELADKQLLPIKDNMWYGSTVTTPNDRLFCANQYKTFVSVEPIKTDFGKGCFPLTDWVIIGAETGKSPHKTKPQRAWIENILDAERGKTPVLMKHSKELETVWGDELIQEWPKELTRPEDIPTPHCKECEFCHFKEEGKRGDRHECEIGWEPEGYTDRGARHIAGRYTRTSPPWCPKRKEEQT